MTSKERINQRFAKDFNLPINIFNDQVFEYYHRLYRDSIWPEEEWVSLNKEINERFHGNMDLWLEHYATVRDTIIRDIEASEAYQHFNNKDMSEYQIKGESIRNLPDRTIYNNELNGGTFVSLDLKKANFQALKYAGVINDECYDAFIEKYDESFYFKKSKYTRQVIFGKLNPKRTITVEHYMMSQIFGLPLKELEGVQAKIIAFKSDEIVWQVYGKVSTAKLNKIIKDVKEKLGFDITAEYFTIEKLPIENVNGNSITAYVKRNLNTGEEKLKMVSTTYFPQVYKLYKGMPIEREDMAFYHEDQCAHFDYPLKLVYDGSNGA